MSAQTIPATSIKASPMTDGSCQTRAATRHAPPSPARPRTIPKNEAGTAVTDLLVVLQLERRQVVVELRPARAPGDEREAHELRRHIDLGPICVWTMPHGQLLPQNEWIMPSPKPVESE